MLVVQSRATAQQQDPSYTAGELAAQTSDGTQLNTLKEVTRSSNGAVTRALERAPMGQLRNNCRVNRSKVGYVAYAAYFCHVVGHWQVRGNILAN